MSSGFGTGYDPSLRKSLEAARVQAMTPLSRDDVTEIVNSVLHSLEGDVTAQDFRLYRELEALARFIQTTHDELAVIQPDEIIDRHIPTAHDELGAVVGATEQATNIIMDTCDAITNLGDKVPPEINNLLLDYVTRIFEACNFQDITGQRVTKVIKALEHIEAKVDAMMAAFGDEERRARAQSHHHTPEEVAADDDESWLLQGPQLPGQAIDQDEIDRLLASFG